MSQLQRKHKGIIADPFPRLVHKYNYDFKWSQIQEEVYEYLNLVEHGSAVEAGDAKSTVGARYHGPHTWETFKPFMQWLQDPLLETWEKLNYTMDNTNCNPEQSWLNLHKHTGETLEHAHGYVELVVTCYLNLPKNSGFIEYKDPLEYVKINTPTHEHALFYEVPAQTNDVLIFPGWLKHRTQPNNSNEDRVVMTINCM